MKLGISASLGCWAQKFPVQSQTGFLPTLHASEDKVAHGIWSSKIALQGSYQDLFCSWEMGGGNKDK